MNLGSKFMGFDGESMRNMIGSCKSIFGRVFDEGYFRPNYSFVDLERLARFLDEPMMDLDSLDDFELNGIVKIIE